MPMKTFLCPSQLVALWSRSHLLLSVLPSQEDCDMEYFGIDIAAIQQRCKEVGVRHVRFPVRDFDPFDLRLKLPKAVARLAKAHNAGEGVAYIHCTAGWLLGCTSQRHTRATTAKVTLANHCSTTHGTGLLVALVLGSICCSDRVRAPCGSATFA